MSQVWVIDFGSGFLLCLCFMWLCYWCFALLGGFWIGVAVIDVCVCGLRLLCRMLLICFGRVMVGLVVVGYFV